MDQARLRFITYLNDKAKSLINELKIKKMEVDLNINNNKLFSEQINMEQEIHDVAVQYSTLKTLEKVFTLMKNGYLEQGMPYRDFGILSSVLEKSNLNEEDIVELNFFLVDRNINTGILDCSVDVIDFFAIRKHKFQTLSKNDLQKEKIYYNLTKEKDPEQLDEELEWTQEQKEEFSEVSKKYIIDISDFQKQHKIIQECYFNKKDCYTMEDIQAVAEAFIQLDVDQKIVTMIKNVLEKKYNVRTAIEKRQLAKKKKIVTFNKDLLPNNQQYNNTFQQLASIVDLREMMPKSYLNLEQTLECVAMMFRVGIKREEIRKFLWNLEFENTKVEVNPITKYVEIYDKLAFYAQKQILYNELETLESYFQSLFIADDEEYVFWKNCLEEELKQYMKMIPGGYEYEIETGLKKVKSKK